MNSIYMACPSCRERAVEVTRIEYESAVMSRSVVSGWGRSTVFAPRTCAECETSRLGRVDALLVQRDGISPMVGAE